MLRQIKKFLINVEEFILDWKLDFTIVANVVGIFLFEYF